MADKLPRAGYDSHTRRSRRIVVLGELRHLWDLVRVARYFLRLIEDAGGPGRIGMLPGEHYRFAQLAVRTCDRARALVREHEQILDEKRNEDDPVHAERAAYRAAANAADPITEFAPWHGAALAAVDALEAWEPMRRHVFAHTAYDKAAGVPQPEGEAGVAQAPGGADGSRE